MRKLVLSLALLLALATLWTASSAAQQSGGAQQTARQALLEMFFSKTPGTLVKHLPAATRAALDKSGSLTTLQQYSLMATQLQTQGQNLQTFETGSVLLSAEDPKNGQKVEITVENDALRGDRDDIELAFHIIKNGQEDRIPFMPQTTFSMKQEAQVWTLNEISVTIHLPLADPDFLKAITEKMKPQATANTTFTPRAETSVQTGGSDAMVVAAMRTILTAEVTYASVIRPWATRALFPVSTASAVASGMSTRRCSSTAGWPAGKNMDLCLRFRSAAERLRPAFTSAPFPTEMCLGERLFVRTSQV